MTPLASAPTRTPRRLTPSTTPARLRAFATGAIVLAVVVGIVIAIAVSVLRGGLRQIGHRAAPQVVATQDLYFAVSDMDAQLANVLLVGDEQGLGIGHTQALDLYENRRTQADQDLQQAAAAAGGDAGAQRALKSVLDAFGRYEGLAAQTVLLDERAHHPAGRPPAEVVVLYRQATDQLRYQVFPSVSRLTDANSATLGRSYEMQHSGLDIARWGLVAAGLSLLGTLIGMQVFLIRRFRRRSSPALALAMAGTAALLIASVGTLTAESGHLKVAKKDAFDSILALAQARAISYDANADESRFLVDPERRAQYERSFLAKSQQLANLPGVSLGTYDGDLAAAIIAVRVDGHDVRFSGFLGREFRNITLPGERAAAEQTLSRYRTYQLDDRRLRTLAKGQNLRATVAFNTGLTPGDSNGDFSRYDASLQLLITINQGAFDSAIHDGEQALTGWTLLPPLSVILIAGLVLAGIRPRLAEYR
ncbi:MAG: hypothetical protein JWN52_3093 [Actinomycetia bacterium]|nr:hypothetical protein [Actinomycetes bacterium]